MGSSTTFGTGEWRISLPVAAYGVYSAILPTVLLDNGNGWYQGLSYTEYNGDSNYVVPVLGGGASASQPVNSIVPFTWGTLDSFTFSGSYESI